MGDMQERRNVAMTGSVLIALALALSACSTRDTTGAEEVAAKQDAALRAEKAAERAEKAAERAERAAQRAEAGPVQDDPPPADETPRDEPPPE